MNRRLLMRNLLVLLAVAFMATSCFQTSDPDPKEKGTPPPTATDVVNAPGDVDGWADGCMLDSDCAEMAMGPCQTAVCDNGECVAQDKQPGASCQSDEAKNAGEQSWCQAGEAGIECVVGPAADGTPCGDFYSACSGVGTCQAGACADPCDDGNLCTDGKCTETGCVFTDNTDPCDDENDCTEDDTCTDGACVGTKSCDCSEDKDCDHLNDGDECTGYAYCMADGTCGIKGQIKCKATGLEPCFQNVCNPINGECEEVTGEDGLECADGNECTDGDFCVAGECTGYDDIICEWMCGDSLDDDDDTLFDCDDNDCWGVDDCPTPECEDGVCTALADETCVTCPQDCGECPPECGDGDLDADTGEECDDGAKEPGDGCDENCFVEPAPAAEGDIIITEIMPDPAVIDDKFGEWFEVLNTTAADIDINAWFIQDAQADPQDKHRVFTLGGTVVPANSYFVLAVTAAETNGGIAAGYVYEYSAFKLSNSDDEIYLVSGESTVDMVAYDGAFPGGVGTSMSLSPTKLTAADNDLAMNWCDGVGDYDTDNAGTPGVVNPECPFCGDAICNADENCDTCDDCACAANQDCVTGQCVDKKVDGETCGAPAECASGICVDTVCCNAACDGICEACNLADTMGVCTPTAADDDPADDCAACKVCDGAGACKNVLVEEDIMDDCTPAAEMTCGLNGNCDGTGACAFWDAQTVAEAAKCLADSFFHAVDFCDGMGDITDAGSIDCCPYKCDAAGCLTACQTNDDCCAGFTCGLDSLCAQ